MTKLTVALSIVLGASIPAAGIASQADATPGTVKAQQAAATITISDMKNDPADLTATVGQPITVTNNDPFPHTVTAVDGTFDVEVPAKGTVNLSVPKAGKFPYDCTFHKGQHGPTSITAS
jgi:plastocyanin